LKRIAALLLLLTLRLRRRVLKPPKPSTWVMHCRLLIGAGHRALMLPRMAGLTHLSTCPDGTSLFQDLRPDQIERLRTELPEFGEKVVGRLNALLEVGAFDDWPACDVAVDRKDREIWKPFNDAFTAAVGHAAVWMMEWLGPDLLDCYEELYGIRTTPTGGGVDLGPVRP
jgi:hypothetical protein